MPSLQLDGARLHYRSVGQGSETLLFAHGLLWDSRMYEPQIEALASRYRCVAFDFRGQGKSEITAGGYDMDTLADDAWALCEALDLGPVHWVGLSMGGFVGMRMAVYHPSLIRTLTLLNSAADPEPRANLPRYNALLAVTRALGPSIVAKRLLPTMLAPSTLEDPGKKSLCDRAVEQFRSLDRVGATRATRGVMRRRSVEHLLARIAAPTMVVAGAEDQAIAAARSRAAAAAIPKAQFVSVPRCGHTSTLEAPDEITRLLDEFVAARG